MLENLKSILEKKYEYTLDQMKMCQPLVKKNMIKTPSFVIFGVILLGYILQQVGVLNDYYNLFIVIFAFVLFVMVPLGLSKTNKYSAIVITPKYLIQILGKKEFVIIDYDLITAFDITPKNDMVISQNRKRVIIGMQCYQNDLAPLIEILEAKGKTYDVTKEYMVRPVEINIIDGKIVITDLEVHEDIDDVFEEFYKDYLMLTPGFITDVLFMNSVIEDNKFENGVWSLKFNKLEINEGHPENTSFESIVVEDCIVVFEKTFFKSITIKDAREKNSTAIKQESDFSVIKGQLKKGIVSDWNSDDKEFTFEFATGMSRITVIIEYNEVLVGWNKTKK